MFYQLNTWLKNNGFHPFTCNMLRKVAETVGGEMEDDKRRKIHAGLHHSGGAARKYYNAPTL